VNAAAPGQDENCFPADDQSGVYRHRCGVIVSGEGIMGWFVALFFGVCSAAFAVHLWPGASYLQLSPEGFVACSLFRRQPLIRWDSVSEFRVAPVPGSGMKMVVYSCDHSRHPRLAAVNRTLVGATDALPDTYGRTPDELAALLNEWRLRALYSEPRQ
jgi:hypothetical protein